MESPRIQRQIRRGRRQRLRHGPRRDDREGALPHRAARAARDGCCPRSPQMNREVYRRARESSVRGAYDRLEEILAGEGRTLVVIIALTLVAGLLASWVISRGLARPIRELTAGDGRGRRRGSSITRSRPAPADEIGELARAFGRMTESLRGNVAQLERTQAQLVQSEKLASIGEMAAAVAHGLRNPLASLRAAAQLARRHPDSPAAQEHLDAIIDGGGPPRPPDQPPAELQPSSPVSTDAGERAPAGGGPAAGVRGAAARASGRAARWTCRPPCRRCGWTRCRWSRRCSSSSPTRSMRCPGAARLRIAAQHGERRDYPAGGGHRGERTPAEESRRTSCRRCASPSSRPGRTAPVSVSRSPSGTSSRTGAGWRSRAGPARAPRSASDCPTERGRSMSGTVLIVDDERTLARAVKAFLQRVRLRGRGRGRRGAGARAAGDAAPGRGLLRRPASGHGRRSSCCAGSASSTPRSRSSS